MNIKFTVFRSMLKHSEEFEKETQAFLTEISQKLGASFVNADIEDYDCDLKLLFIQTGGSEGIFLKNIDKIKPPYYLLTNGGNNSLAASLEILTYANLHGLEGEILHGDSNYIANRIKELIDKNRLIDRLSNANLGVIGQPSDWLISSVPDALTVKNKLKINLKYLPLKEVEADILKDNTFGDWSKEQEKSLSVYDNLKSIILKNNLQGLTIRCFDLLSSIKMTGCVALSKLNQEGIVATCEGDIMAMISMYLVKVIFNQSSFQANPSRIDLLNNQIVFAHCTVPLDMVESYKYMTHFESGIGIAVKGELKKAPVTIFRMSSSLKDYTIMQGEIVENLNRSNLCRTQIKIQCKESLSALLKNPCGNHHIIFYGHKKEELNKALSLLLNQQPL